MGAKDYIQEERELELIERNLTFNSEDHTWTVEYPWIKDPNDLPDNRKVAMVKLAATERRLRNNADHANVYDEQIKDMLARNVARKLSKEELTNYTGPTHFRSVDLSEGKQKDARMINSAVILIHQTFVSFIVEEKTNLNFVQLRSDPERRSNIKRLFKHVSQRGSL